MRVHGAQPLQTSAGSFEVLDKDGGPIAVLFGIYYAVISVPVLITSVALAIWLIKMQRSVSPDNMNFTQRRIGIRVVIISVAAGSGFSGSVLGEPVDGRIPLLPA